MNILEQTFKEMPVVFSSNAFAKKARGNGLTEEAISNGEISKFLHIHAEQFASRRMWSKKYGNSGANKNVSQTDKVNDAITLLKSLGYKIMKPFTDWTEI